MAASLRGMRHPAVAYIVHSTHGGSLQSFQLHLAGEQKHRRPRRAWFPVACGSVRLHHRVPSTISPDTDSWDAPFLGKTRGAFCDPGFRPIASSRSSSTAHGPRRPSCSTDFHDMGSWGSWGSPRQMPNPLLGTSRQMKDRMTGSTGHYPLLASALHTAGTRLVGGEPPTEGDASRTGNSPGVGVGAHSGPPYTRHRPYRVPQPMGRIGRIGRAPGPSTIAINASPDVRARRDGGRIAIAPHWPWMARPTGG